jgi:hypothetical protein
MPSVALLEWQAGRAAALDEIENAHRSVGGAGPGRRYATQQINFAYAMLLASQFQGHCRTLHTECVTHLVTAVSPVFRPAVRAEFLLNRRLDRGNVNSDNLEADFGRLGLVLWTELVAVDVRNRQRRQLLDELNEWRNAIAHHDFARVLRGAPRPVLHLSQVQQWRRADDVLARDLDGVLAAHIQRITGAFPW